MPQRRVLVVDDEDTIREIAALSLEAVAGWDVLTAASGRDGHREAAAAGPDAILLDVMMPDLDGPATVALLRSDPATSGIPIILVTAKVQASERQRFSSLDGVSGVIAKPFDPMTLAEQVQELLAWRS
jgi:CheY-like chemotaxis protein